jgi:hypothetical protein
MLHPLPVGGYDWISTFRIDLGFQKPKVIAKG